jgi:membrane-associated protease RseP (regulator of RpoE activity)
MSFTLGVVLFALAIFISVCLHEAGHMLTAKGFGMKVTRYFAGFGPTLWSFKRGETEYGIKAIPAGGFVKIVGMTPQDDDVEPGDEKRAMWRFPVWKRTIVMAAGSATHFIIAFIALWIMGMAIGFPNPQVTELENKPLNQLRAYVAVSPCIPAGNALSCNADTDPVSPAKASGLRDGDLITAINGVAINNYDDLSRQIRTLTPGSAATVQIQRAGVTQTLLVLPTSAMRAPIDDPNGVLSPVPVIGITAGLPPGVPLNVTYGPIDSIGASGRMIGQMATNTWHSLGQIPSRIPMLWTAITGGERDPNTPISVVGASRLGGEAVAHDQWGFFLFLFVIINFFVGVFNLLPLLPLDGGHIAIAWFERARSWLYARIGRRDPGRVDYNKLMPITYMVILLFGGLTLLTVTADIVNPITIFK